MTLYVKKSGLYSTVQDLGRDGYLHMGIPSSGALDFRSHILVNRLLGNDINNSIIEMTYVGSHFKVKQSNYIAVVGADMQFKINDKKMPLGEVIAVKKNDEITFGKVNKGMRTYLGIAGGFHTEKFLGSSATHESLGIGGISGRRLKEGDILKSIVFQTPKQNLKLRNIKEDKKIRIIAGQQFDYFSQSEIYKLLNNEYKISTQSDRMGFRLEGESLCSHKGYDILSEPTFLGSIQIPRDGQPIVLLNERQTIGGYPKVATIIKADIPIITQLQPGELFSFKLIELGEAKRIYNELMDKLKNNHYLMEHSQVRRNISCRISGLLGGE